MSWKAAEGAWIRAREREERLRVFASLGFPTGEKAAEEIRSLLPVRIAERLALTITTDRATHNWFIDFCYERPNAAFLSFLFSATAVSIRIWGRGMTADYEMKPSYELLAGPHAGQYTNTLEAGATSFDAVLAEIKTLHTPLVNVQGFTPVYTPEADQVPETYLVS